MGFNISSDFIFRDGERWSIEKNCLPCCHSSSAKAGVRFLKSFSQRDIVLLEKLEMDRKSGGTVVCLAALIDSICLSEKKSSIYSELFRVYLRVRDWGRVDIFCYLPLLRHILLHSNLEPCH